MASSVFVGYGTETAQIMMSAGVASYLTTPILGLSAVAGAGLAVLCFWLLRRRGAGPVPDSRGAPIGAWPPWPLRCRCRSGPR
jgi:hypothetical protein